MKIGHMKEMIRRLYRRPTVKVDPTDRRFLEMQVFLLFGIR